MLEREKTYIHHHQWLSYREQRANLRQYAEQSSITYIRTQVLSSQYLALNPHNE
jgi:hypothetical protein